MDDQEIQSLVQKLDTADFRLMEKVWDQLRPLGIAVVPYLTAFYPSAKKWQGRVTLVFHAIRYARASDAAFELGVSALNDKSTLVRYRACGLLAYSLNKAALPSLEKLLSHSDEKTVADAKAAIDAIEHQNHHYFIDRSHSGKTSWEVNKEDR